MAKKTAKKVKKKSAKKAARSTSAAASGSKSTKKSPSTRTTKKTTTKKTTKRVAKKTAKNATVKKSTKKSATKPAKKTAKKVAKKPTQKKSATKKAASKASVTKKPATKKPTTKKSTTKKPASKKSTTKKPAAEKAAESASAKPETNAKADASKGGSRKGITIVNKPEKRSGSKSKASSKFVMPERPQLLGPGSAFGSKPLIPSGPSAPKITSVFDAPKSRRTKSPLTKAKLEKFRLLLIAKRAELLGDVTSMENEALRSGGSGGLSRTPQHAAEQGSDSYDQTLSLNLAAQDRRLIKDIDEALKRIEDGTYGLCELTGHPIPEDRLTELPWARYTIEAARELERRGPSA